MCSMLTHKVVKFELCNGYMAYVGEQVSPILCLFALRVLSANLRVFFVMTFDFSEKVSIFQEC